MDFCLGRFDEDVSCPDFVLTEFAIPRAEREIPPPLSCLSNKCHEKTGPGFILLLDEGD
jgi:hypothetical protein